MENQKITGTNCFNCTYISKNPEAIDQNTLNSQGGINPQNEEEMERAEKADLITLPGGNRNDVISKKYCSHSDIQMYVTVRMCCGYWDAQGVIRPWKTNEVVQPMAQ